jgi:CRISPR/Cas system-associated exonuclease Cas4 (RecB family)
MFSAAIKLGADDGLAHYRPLAVTAALRGFAAEESQLRIAVAEDEAVSITGCVARRCPTGRDLYFERRYKLDAPSWERSVIGKIVDTLLGSLHLAGLQCLEDAFEKTTTNGEQIDLDKLGAMIREKGEDLARVRLLEHWKYPGKDTALKELSIEQFATHVAGASGSELIEKTLEALNDLVRHETTVLIDFIRRRRRNGRIMDFLRRQPGRWMAEVRAVLARLQAEVQLDDPKKLPAGALGLSGCVKPDVLYAVTLVGDVKSGTFHDYYASVATGYAIFVEYALKTRVNTAAIVAVDLDLKAGKLRSLRVIPIQSNDEQRRRWLAQRNGAIDVLRSPSPPAHPDDQTECRACHYLERCWLNGTVGGTPITPDAPQKPAPAPSKKKGESNSGGGKPPKKSKHPPDGGAVPLSAVDTGASEAGDPSDVT